jgi:hypothetical protein
MAVFFRVYGKQCCGTDTVTFCRNGTGNRNRNLTTDLSGTGSVINYLVPEK